VVLKIAATLDGRIATRSGDARWVTGTAARSHVHRLRHDMDAILVGIGTVQADDPRLTARLEEGQGVDPARFVLDTNLHMSPGARMLNQDSPASTYVVCGPGAPEDKRQALAEKGAQILEVPLKKRRIDLQHLMERMGRMEITSLLIEGGGRVAASALAEDIVDKIIFFYAPKLFGGDDGIPMCRGQGPLLMKDALKVEDLTVSRVGDDIMVEGYRHRP